MEVFSITCIDTDTHLLTSWILPEALLIPQFIVSYPALVHNHRKQRHGKVTPILTHFD